MTNQNFKKTITINRTKTLTDYGYTSKPVYHAGLRRVAVATWWHLHNRDISSTRDGYLIAVIAHETKKALFLTIYDAAVPSIQVTEVWNPKAPSYTSGSPHNDNYPPPPHPHTKTHP